RWRLFRCLPPSFISNDYEGGRQASEQPPAVYRLEPETGEIRIVANDFDGPNGLAFSPDETRLYVAETGKQTAQSPRQYIRVFNVQPDGATLSGGDIFYKIEPGYCDGMRVDEHGNIWSRRLMVFIASVQIASCSGGYSCLTESQT